MELYEKINEIITIKKMSKKKFIKIFLSLEPKLKSTGEIPLEATVYAYLNGTRELKIELIPYVAEALNIVEQELFDNTENARLNYLKYILKMPTDKELYLIKETLSKHNIDLKNNDISINTIGINHGNIHFVDDINKCCNKEAEELSNLLPYASKPLISNFIKKLKKMKELSDI